MNEKLRQYGLQLGQVVVTVYAISYIPDVPLVLRLLLVVVFATLGFFLNRFVMTLFVVCLLFACIQVHTLWYPLLSVESRSLDDALTIMTPETAKVFVGCDYYRINLADEKHSHHGFLGSGHIRAARELEISQYYKGGGPLATLEAMFENDKTNPDSPDVYRMRPTFRGRIGKFPCIAGSVYGRTQTYAGNGEDNVDCLFFRAVIDYDDFFCIVDGRSTFTFEDCYLFPHILREMQFRPMGARQNSAEQDRRRIMEYPCSGNTLFNGVQDHGLALQKLVFILVNNGAPKSESTQAMIRQYDDAVVAAGAFLTGKVEPPKHFKYDANLAQSITLDLLMSIGSRAQLALPDIITFVKNTQDVELKTKAIHLLGTIGPVASEALPLLQEIAGGDREALREAAKNAVAKIGAVP